MAQTHPDEDTTTSRNKNNTSATSSSSSNSNNHPNPATGTTASTMVASGQSVPRYPTSAPLAIASSSSFLPAARSTNSHGNRTMSASMTIRRQVAAAAGTGGEGDDMIDDSQLLSRSLPRSAPIAIAKPHHHHHHQQQYATSGITISTAASGTATTSTTASSFRNGNVGMLPTIGSGDDLLSSSSSDDDSVIDVERDAIKLEQRRQRIRRAVLGDDVIMSYDDDDDRNRLLQKNPNQPQQIQPQNSNNSNNNHRESENSNNFSMADTSRDSDRPYPSSLPSRLLLRAPLLKGSVPSNFEMMFDRYNDEEVCLPPPMAIAATAQPDGTENSTINNNIHTTAKSVDDRPQNYGSLRDSQLRGRFLDGPSSYRDARTGDIRRIQHRVRFQDGGAAAAGESLPELSIGERILQSTTTRRAAAAAAKAAAEATANNNKMASSSLTAMFQQETTASATASSSKNDTTAKQRAEESYEIPILPQRAFYDDEEVNDDMDGNRDGDAENGLCGGRMLSTSLTGLEVLQAGLHIGAAAAAKNRNNNLVGTVSYRPDELDELPRDANGNNAVLSRTMSDPTPVVVRTHFSRIVGQTQQKQQHQKRHLTPISSPLVLSRPESDNKRTPKASYQAVQPSMPQVLLPTAAAAATTIATSNSNIEVAATMARPAVPASFLGSTCTTTTLPTERQQQQFHVRFMQDPSSQLQASSFYPPNGVMMDGFLLQQQDEQQLLYDNEDENNPDVETTFDMDME